MNNSAATNTDNNETERRLALSDARPDIIAVVTALYSELVFPDGTNGNYVFFKEKPLVISQKPEKVFGLSDVYLEEDYQPDENPQVRIISGVMRLSDYTGREDYRAYSAEYLVTEEAIYILSSAIKPLYGRYDRVRFFFVEKDQLPSLSHLEKAGYKELLPLVAKNAVDPDLIINNTGMKDLYIFIFDMTRGSSDSDLILHSGGNITDTAVNFSKSVNNNGWRFIMVDGQFRLGKGSNYSFFLTETSNPDKVISAIPASIK